MIVRDDTRSSAASHAARLSDGADGKLWRRICADLKELRPERLEDQLEKLSREVAREMPGTNAG